MTSFCDEVMWHLLSDLWRSPGDGDYDPPVPRRCR